MIVFFAYVSLALIQLYRQYQRRTLYSGAMLRALRSGSILVQRGKGAKHGSVGALLNSSLLSCSRSYKETLLLSDEHLAVSAVSPKQQVDLGEWSSYLELHPPQTNSNGVVVLLEAGPPDSSKSTPVQQLPMLASKVQVLKHGCPLAWKYGNPFGIILHCTYEDFVILCDGLGQGKLTLNEDLQLYQMLTISTVGKAKSLRRPKSEMMASASEKNSPVKAIRANTDPVLLLVTHSEDGDSADLTRAADMDVSKPKVELDSSAVKHQDGLASGVSVTERARPVDDNRKTTASELSDASGVAGSASDILVQKEHAVLEESPVIPVCASFVSSQKTKTQALPSSVPGEHESQSMAASDVSCSLLSSEKQIPEEGYLSLDSGNTLSNAIPIVPHLNGSGEHSVRYVKKDSVSITDSEQFAEESSTKKGEDKNLSVTENDGSCLQKDFSTSNSVSSQQDAVTTDTEISPVAKKSEQSSDKSATMNGSAHLLNGSSATMEEQSVEQLKDIIKASNRDTSKGKEKVAPQSSSKNGAAHDADASMEGKASIAKPPNVVVYCGKKDSARKFDMIREGLEQCLNTSAYAIYLLPHEEVMTLPWENSSAALIISHDYLHDNICRKFTSYLLNGGKVLSFSSSLEAEFLVRKEVKGQAAITKFSLQKWQNVNSTQGRYQYVPGSLKRGNSSMDTLVVDPTTSQPLVVRVMLSPENGNGKAIFSQLLLERDPSEMASDSKTFSQLKQSSKQRWEVVRHLLSLLDLDTSLTPSLALTPCYLLVQDQALLKSFMDTIAGRMKQDTIRSRALSLKFVTSKSAGSSALTATSDTLPVVTDTPAGSFKGLKDGGHLQYFDPEVYWDHLTTSVLGRVVLYTEVIPTIMPIFEGIQFSLPEDLGLIAVAGHQTSGKGRGGNQWLSPVGCAMFALPLRLPADSPLGQRVSFLQHIVALAVVHSLRSLPGYEDLDLRLKWPNDIYFGKKTKLGGVLVNSTIMDKTLHATVGCGVNISNSLPTICINSIIDDHNRTKGANLKTLTTSEVLAHTVSMIETLVAHFQEKDHQDFCQLYYKYWLHSGARVKLESEGNAEVEITGLDDFGFLRVVNQHGQKLSVQPDGNSFDMMHNLISIKRD